ncbi:hypothetical protein [Micromonospora profundi]|uniref:hypothetical protein n=1 Tax=Micromonospora profundi TaxID=1420889 RepID=UPI00364B3BEB
MTAPAPTKPRTPLDRPLLPDPPRHPANPEPIPPRPCHNQQVTCPTCGGPVASLLAACWATPACLTEDLDYDAAIDARNDDL